MSTRPQRGAASSLAQRCEFEPNLSIDVLAQHRTPDPRALPGVGRAVLDTSSPEYISTQQRGVGAAPARDSSVNGGVFKFKQLALQE